MEVFSAHKQVFKLPTQLLRLGGLANRTGLLEAESWLTGAAT